MPKPRKQSHATQYVIHDVNIAADRLFKARSNVEESMHPAVARDIVELMDEAANRIAEVRARLEAYRDRMLKQGD